jgi:glyoxylase-like metal-dependent hydrolase (beta-lactamase superfamily II)
MLKKVAMAAAALVALGGFQAPPASKPLPELSLWRLDCGNFLIKDFNAFFSDTMAYAPGQAKNITSSCYLIRNGNRYMLWDTGLTTRLIGNAQDSPAQRIELKTSIFDQLKRIGVRPNQIELIGISHYHSDHLGQAANFPQAELVIGKGDLDALKARPTPQGMEPDLLKPWISGGRKVTAVDRDVDFFKDGRVIMLKTPGHTPGHNALLVKLASGNVLLSGDLYHFTEQVPIKGVPPFNTDRADTLASMDRFDRIARNLRAKVIIQHEAADIAKLPLFPEAAR